MVNGHTTPYSESKQRVGRVTRRKERAAVWDFLEARIAATPDRREIRKRG